MDVYETRRLNLVAHIDSKHDGNRAAFCRASGKNPNLINLVLTDNPEYRRNIGEKLARDLEARISLPSGWLDSPHGVGDRKSAFIPISVLPWIIPDETPSDSDFGITIPLDDPRLSHRITGIKNLLVVVSQDSNMSPAIQINDYVWVDLGVKKFTGDGVYVVRGGETTAFKRIQQMTDIEYRISTEDKSFEPITLRGTEFSAVKIVGRVMSTWRNHQL